uniref:Uncharacterized protein n=1 Tax=Mustela putorius furo TaxID=9669 RepID=M3YL09_MUSPF
CTINGFFQALSERERGGHPVYKPLCVRHVSRAPGARASSRRARRSVGIPTLVLQLGRLGGRGSETTRPSPSPAPSARPGLVHRAQRVERMGAGVLRRSRKSNDKAGGAPAPAWRPTPTPPRKLPLKDTELSWLSAPSLCQPGEGKQEVVTFLMERIKNASSQDRMADLPSVPPGPL